MLTQIKLSRKLLSILKKEVGPTKIKHGVEGSFPVREGSNKNYVIGGTWSDGITVLNEETDQEFELWKPTPLPENSLWNQNFSRMSLQLNHLTDSLA